MSDSTDPHIQELHALSKDDLDKRLSRYGVKSLPKAQAIVFLTNVHLAATQDKAAPSKQKRAGSSAKKPAKKKVQKPTTESGELGLKNEKPRAKAKRPKVPANQVEKTVPVITTNKVTQIDLTDDSVVILPSESEAVKPSSPAKTKAEKSSSRALYKVKLLDSSSDGDSDDSDVEVISISDEPDQPHTEAAPKTAAKRKQPKSSKISTPDEVKAVMLKYIRDRPSLYAQMLQYETIYLKPFIKQLKEDGVVVKTGLLMDFFDSQTICFSQHDADKPRQWGGKKKAKKSPKKSAPKTP